MEPLQSNDGIPLYVQVRNILKSNIEQGAWKPGDMIPPEPELVRMFGVSRATVRQAVGELVASGCLNRKQGKGTFVSPPRFDLPVRELYGFTEYMGRLGLHPESRLVEFEIHPPSPEIRDKLGLSEMERVIRFVRLRLLQGELIMLETTCLPRAVFYDLTDDDIRKDSLYAIFERRYGIKLSSAVEYFEPVLIDGRSSKLLEVDRGSPALYMERLGMLPDGRCVEVSQSIVRGDRCRVFAQLLRPL